jgi:hypothetical protein
MYKRTIKSFIAMAMIALLLVTCTKSDTNGVYFAANIDLKSSSLPADADRASTNFYFSTDNGVTFTDAANLKVGQKYQVKVKANGCVSGCKYASPGEFLTKASFYSLDWSLSDPKPNSATADAPEFTLQSANTLSVKIVDVLCNYSAASWKGVWKGDEVGACCGGMDLNNITQDPSNPNKFIMDNFWGDGVNAYILLSPSTTYWDQIVTLPSQTTSEGGKASGTGTYDQCRGTFTINTTYVIGGKSYNWQYNFHR